MKFNKIKIQGQPKTLNVVLLNDLHFGSEAVDYDLLNRIFDFINTNRESTRILINGDVFEMVTKNSKGDLYEQRMTPEEQIELAIEKFTPYADLIDGVTIGNHCARMMDEISVDPVKMLCKELGILDKYLKWEGVVGYSWNKKFYSIEMFHGAGSGSTVASIERNMNRMRKTTADVFYTAHWHKEYAKPFKEYNVDPFNQVVKEQKKWFICGNTIVNTAQYAKRYRYAEGFPSQAVLKLDGAFNKKKIEVEWIR